MIKNKVDFDLDCSSSNIFDDILKKIDELGNDLRFCMPAEEENSSKKICLQTLAKSGYSLRREIDKIFAYEGFSQCPAWDIMLDLFVANHQQKTVSVSSATIGAACPATTGLRWLSVLGQLGLIVRSNDPTDKRRAIVSLTEDGWNKTSRALQVNASRPARAQIAFASL